MVVVARRLVIGWLIVGYGTTRNATKPKGIADRVLRQSLIASPAG
jgi:hypothetical protein